VFGANWQDATVTLKRARVSDVVLEDQTRLDGTVLSLDGVGLGRVARVAGGAALADVTLEVAHPGESARIVHVLDALPALTGADGPAFGGFLGPPQPAASGTLHMLQNLAILTCAEMPWGAGGLLIAREALVDMSGPLAPLSPFGSTFNVVLRVQVAPDRAEVEYESAVRRAGLAVADALGRVAAGAAASERAEYSLEPADPDLPRIAYIYQVHSQGLFARTFLYGKELDGMVPTILHPNELRCGALVSGNYVYGSFKTPTWLHVNNPVTQLLMDGHGGDHAFVGIVLSRGHHYSAWEKERSANLAAHQAWLLGADGVALTWEGGGNSITDAMLTIRACERLGLKTAAVAYEMGDEDAADVVLLDSVPEADALVSTGTTKGAVQIPRIERILGGDALRLRPEIGGEYVAAEGPLEIDTPYMLYCSAGQTGFGTLAGVAY
jgi:glycine reductase complex component B subunit alpha and beta